MSFISIVGIALGVATLITSYSIGRGFEKEYHRTILDFNAHIVVLKQSEISDYNQLFNELKSEKWQEKGLVGATPFIYREGLIVHNKKVKGVVIKGIDPENLPSVSNIKMEFFDANNSLTGNFANSDTVLVGSALADFIGIDEESSSINLLTPGGSIENVSDADKYLKLNVVGTFESGLYDYDSQFILMTNKSLQSIFNMGDKVTGFEIKLDDPDKAFLFGRELAHELQDSTYKITDWSELNRNLFQAVKLEKLVFTLIMGIMVIVASFNIIGTIIISIIDKRRQISVLKALGTPVSKLIVIFLTQGLLLGLIGAILGLILGLFTIWGVGAYQIIPIDPEIYFLNRLPVAFSPIAYAMLFIAAFGLCGVTSYVAAKKVTDMNIVNGLGNNY
ncbi:ABC transporter permease [bacterium]|nr:ABC transporter permease [bacterium]